VAPDDSLHRGEADAVTFEFLDAWKALEGEKQLFSVRHVEATPVVPDKAGLSAFD